MSFLFEQKKRPPPLKPDFSLSNLISKQIEENDLTIYFINLVVVKANNLSEADFMGKSDPYCVVKVGGTTNTTKHIDNTCDPVWNETMQFFVPSKPESIAFDLWDKDNIGKDDFLGTSEFKISDQFETGEDFSGPLVVLDNKKPRGSLTVRMSFQTIKPLETEVKLKHKELELECKTREFVETVAVLDESETERELVITQLAQKDDEVTKKSQELEDTKTKLTSEITQKDTELASTQKLLDAKIEESEVAQLALVAAEASKAEAILEKDNQISEIEKQKNEAILEKDKQISEIETQKNEAMALKVAAESDLGAKDGIILAQTAELEEKSKESSLLKEELEAKEKTLKTRDDVLKKLQDQINELKETQKLLQAENVGLKEDLDTKTHELENKNSCFCF